MGIKALVREAADRLLVRAGLGHSEARLAADAKDYWTRGNDDTWQNNAHIRAGSVFTKGQLWDRVGLRHRDLFDQMMKVLPERRIGRAVEWGVGGGANAVAFAPAVQEFIGVDVAQTIVDEAGRQVRARTETPFTPVVIDLEHPEAAEPDIGSVDLFLCLYVLELVPSPQYGVRIMQIAYRLLNPGGVAFVQIKYDTGRWNTHSRRRRYRESVVGSMTSYRIDELWELMSHIGFEHAGLHLVPKNELDERYAYFLLRRP